MPKPFEQYLKLNHENDAESVLCLMTLIVVGELNNNATILDSNKFYESIKNQDCGNCKYTKKCLACMINE